METKEEIQQHVTSQCSVDHKKTGVRLSETLPDVVQEHLFDRICGIIEKYRCEKATSEFSEKEPCLYMI